MPCSNGQIGIHFMNHSMISTPDRDPFGEANFELFDFNENKHYPRHYSNFDSMKVISGSYRGQSLNEIWIKKVRCHHVTIHLEPIKNPYLLVTRNVTIFIWTPILWITIWNQPKRRWLKQNLRLLIILYRKSSHRKLVKVYRKWTKCH